MAPQAGVQMLEPEVVRQVRGLKTKGWGVKRIARELGIAPATPSVVICAAASRPRSRFGRSGASWSETRWSRRSSCSTAQPREMRSW